MFSYKIFELKELFSPSHSSFYSFCLVFWILSFDCSFCFIAWYLYFYFFTYGLCWWTFSPRGYLPPGSLISINKYNNESTLAQASPIVKMPGPVTPKDTGVTCNLGVPRIILWDVIKQNYDQSDDHQFFYRL